MAVSLTNLGKNIINTTINVGDWVGKLLHGEFDVLSKAFDDWLTKRSNEVRSDIEDYAKRTGQSMDDIDAAMEARFKESNRLTEMSVGGLWDSLTGLAGDILNNMMTYLGTAFQGFAEWIFEHLSRFADLVVGAVRFIVDRVGDAVRGLVAWLTDGITGAMMKGSPPKEIEVASNVLMQTTFSRQFEMIDSMYHSEPTAAQTFETAEGIMAMLFAGGAVALSLGIAADVVHPIKGMGWRPTVREMVYWAGIPSVTAAIAVLPSSIGLLVPLRYALYEQWQPLIPDTPDLIRFALREVFIEEERQRLLQPGPGDDFYNYMRKQGYNRFWADAYWAAHWVRPTTTQLNEMYYRNIISREEWTREIRLNDVVPYSIPWLDQIIHPPYTRVDVRRMWEMGTIDEDTLRREYRWLGYDDEHADGMVLWTKIYTALPDLIARYKNGWISSDDVLQTLIQLGMSQERATEVLQTKIKAVQQERVSGERDLTKTDILRLLGIGEISDSQAHELLMGIGYDSDEATYLIAIQMDKMGEELKELTSAQILKAYRYEIMKRDETLTKLVEAGWSLNAAETMLKLEDVKLADSQVERQRERDLSRADITNAMKREIIDAQTGYQYLAYLGYSEWEIKVIFALEGFE